MHQLVKFSYFCETKTVRCDGSVLSSKVCFREPNSVIALF